MRTRMWMVMALGLAVAAWNPARAQEEAPVAAGPEVTLKGIMMWEISCVLKPTKEDNDKKTMVLFAVEGTPEVAATLDAIMKEHWPGDSMNGEQARNLNDAFTERLKYYITPGELATKHAKDGRWRNPMMAVTGVVSERDGKKWITPTRIQGTRLKYPDKMLAPDKPLKMPGKEPLILKVTDTLSLKCILLPRGEFLMAKPWYVDPRWQDEFPRHITLTKPFWLAEIPVTQEMYEAVMGNNPSDQKGPQVPVTQVPCTEIQKFCRMLSERNGRKVRLPTQAEWEYAARVGTSNPSTVNAKYDGQVNVAPDGKTLLPVKSRQPNAWGLYDMVSCAWEITGDRRQFSRQDTVDPHYTTPCEIDEKSGRKHDHNALGRNCFSWTTTREGVGNGSRTGYTLTKFRVAVDATPEEIAEMEKAAKR